MRPTIEPPVAANVLSYWLLETGTNDSAASMQGRSLELFF